MMVFSSTRRAARRFRADRRGGATIEFTIIFPILFLMFGTLMETGLLAARYILLDRGLDIAARELRLGYMDNPTHDSMKQEICDAAVILVNCERDLLLEVVEFDPDAAYPRNQPNCVDRTGVLAPVLDYNPGTTDVKMFLRACVIVDPIFPGVGLGLALPKDSSGGFQMVSYTIYRNEPV